MEKTKKPTESELRARVLDRVMKMMKWDERKALIWYYASNPLLGGILPADMVKNGRFDKLMKWIDNQNKGA